MKRRRGGGNKRERGRERRRRSCQAEKRVAEINEFGWGKEFIIQRSQGPEMSVAGEKSKGKLVVFSVENKQQQYSQPGCKHLQPLNSNPDFSSSSRTAK